MTDEELRHRHLKRKEAAPPTPEEQRSAAAAERLARAFGAAPATEPPPIRRSVSVRRWAWSEIELALHASGVPLPQRDTIEGVLEAME